MTDPCPHCPPDRVWDHEHIGDTTQPLLMIARDVPAHKEWYFHGNTDQLLAYTYHPNRDDVERFEELLLQYKDWDKALEALA